MRHHPSLHYSSAAFATLCLGCCLAAQTAGAQLAAALLPSSRSAEVNATITVFATIINAGSATETGCRIEHNAGLPIGLTYQTTDPSTNLPTGSANTPATIAAGASQSFVLSVTPTSVLDATEVSFDMRCDSGEAATVITGVNTLLLSASSTPVPDIIALAATSQNTGVLALSDNAGAFALSSINIGAPDDITIAVDTGDASLPVVLSLCETNPGTGACLAPPGDSVVSTMGTGATPTFSVFSTASGTVPFDPALNRVFVRFLDSGNLLRGGTSVAIEGAFDDGGPDLSARAVEILNRVLAILFGDGVTGSTGATALAAVRPAAPTPINDVVPCTTGQIVVSGTSDIEVIPAVIDLDMDFQNCDDIDGLISVDALVTPGLGALDLEVVQNGTVAAEECEEITMTDLTVRVSTDLSGQFLTPPLTSGTISGTCEGVAFVCTLDQLDVRDEAGFVDSCDV